MLESLTAHLKRGQDGEKQAVAYLKKSGYRILEKNWRHHPVELDVICQNDDTIVFVEVKTRKDENEESAMNAFNSAKKKNILTAACAWLTQNEKWGNPCRFDFITITGAEKNLQHRTNVLELDDSFSTKTWQVW